jgi:hypothetical protein
MPPARSNDILMAGGCLAESPLLRDTAGIRWPVPAALRNGFPLWDNGRRGEWVTNMIKEPWGESAPDSEKRMLRVQEDDNSGGDPGDSTWPGRGRSLPAQALLSPAAGSMGGRHGHSRRGKVELGHAQNADR